MPECLNAKEMKTTNLMTLSYLASSEFRIPTKSIYELMDQLNEWFTMGVCGAIVCGRSRVGKTCAISYAMDYFTKEYGMDFPIMLWTMSEKSVGLTDKSFYANLLDVMGMKIEKYTSTSALEMKNRVINYIAIKASEFPIKKAILIIDEAYKLGMKEYYWLMDIYNILNFRYHVVLNIFMFGTPREMYAMRKNFIANKQTQIVERFLLNEHTFKGISSIKEIRYCLAELDRTSVNSCMEEGSVIKLPEFYFPEAFKEEKACFYNLGKKYWDAFIRVKKTNHLTTDDIPMQYFMQSFILCLSTYGCCGKDKKYFLDQDDIVNAIERTGYGRSADE